MTAMHDSGNDELCPTVERAARLLREPPAVRTEWRAELLAHVAEPMTTVKLDEPRRWSLRPSTAIAAALLCAALGGEVTLAVIRHDAVQRESQTAAQAGASQVRFVLVA